MTPAVSPPFAWTTREGSPALFCTALPAWHGWTTRALDLDRDGGWARLAAAAQLGPGRIISLRQIHSAEVVEARAGTAAGRAADAVVSRDSGLLLTVRVADCVPLLMADPATGAVAAVHAGWRGTAAGIARRAVDAMGSAFGSRPHALVAAIGPSIGPCCYETGGAVREALRQAGWPAARVDGWFEGPEGRHLNLWRATAEQLTSAGVAAGSVFTAGLCTACHREAFHSYRRDGEHAGRMAGYIRAAANPA